MDKTLKRIQNKIQKIISTRKLTVLIVVGLASEVLALWLGKMSGSRLGYSNCYGSPPMQAPSAIFAACGVILAIMGLRISIKRKKAAAIVGAAVAALVCVILALVALVAGSFCIPF